MSENLMILLRLSSRADIDLLREALTGAASVRRRAAEAGSASVTAAAEPGQDLRTPALMVMRVLGEAGRLEVIAEQCTPEVLVDLTVEDLVPGLSNADDTTLGSVTGEPVGPPLLDLEPTADPSDPPPSPEAAATIANLTSKGPTLPRAPSRRGKAAKLAQAAAAGVAVPRDPSVVADELDADDVGELDGFQP